MIAARRRRGALHAGGVVVVAVVLTQGGRVTGQVQVQRTPSVIQSLTEPAEQLEVGSRSVQTGNAIFARTRGQGILLSLDASAPADMRALSFVDLYGEAFGLASRTQLTPARAVEVDGLGIEHVRFQQVHRGVPIAGAQFVVHLKGARVVVANGHVVTDLPDDVIPTVPAADAEAAARALMLKRQPDQAGSAQYRVPRLEILNRGLLSGTRDFPSRLAWFVEVTGFALREFLWIDAKSGVVLLNFGQLAHAKSRRVFTAGHTNTLPGTLVRTEGGAATGDADQDNAYSFSGVTYDYFLSNHGRDSFDNAGSELISTVHYCAPPQCPSYANAFWNGSQMVYGDGFASADDVVGHELTHAVTERTSGLFYYMQSGALNESFSDIFGETIDLTDGLGNDASGVRWRMGEDLPGGAIRNMMTPTSFGDPGKMSDSAFWCDNSGYTDPDGDRGGVHVNSGVPNHAFALMVDGGSYNGRTVTGIGVAKSAKIHYRALTTYLTQGSGFIDHYNAVNQSCTDLIGTAGITSSDCTQVTNALVAVEINTTWACSGAVQAPQMCPGGTVATTFADTFETTTSNWTASNTANGTWSSRTPDFAKAGLYSAYGNNPPVTSDHRLAMANAVNVPANARLYFDHAFEFENDFFAAYDGGVLEYSVNNGSTWTDAGTLIDAGRSYNGTVSNSFSNALGGRSAFVRASHGYTGTRLNLATLTGQNVRFRFRIGTDSILGSLGWVVDNFSLYTCSAVLSGIIYVADSAGGFGTVDVTAGTSTRIGSSGVALTDIAVTTSGTVWGIDFDRLYSINPSTGAATLVGSLGVGGMNALVADGNALLAASSTSTSLYSVNTSSGAATALSGSLGHVSGGDLVFHRGRLYAAVINGSATDLVQVNLAGVSFTAMNLGRVLDSATLFGLAVGADHNLYGLAGTTAILINPAIPSAAITMVPNYAANGSGLGTANGASSRLVPFTDDPLISGVTVSRAAHITELRTRIDSIRTALGLSPYAWTDAALTVQSSIIKAVHISDLRIAISEAYTKAGLSAPTFSDASLAGAPIRAIHVTEVRAAVSRIH